MICTKVGKDTSCVGEDVSILCDIFPNIHIDLITKVFSDNNGAVDVTVEQLLAIFSNDDNATNDDYLMELCEDNKPLASSIRCLTSKGAKASSEHQKPSIYPGLTSKQCNVMKRRSEDTHLNKHDASLEANYLQYREVNLASNGRKNNQQFKSHLSTRIRRSAKQRNKAVNSESAKLAIASHDVEAIAGACPESSIGTQRPADALLSPFETNSRETREQLSPRSSLLQRLPSAVLTSPWRWKVPLLGALPDDFLRVEILNQAPENATETPSQISESCVASSPCGNSDAWATGNEYDNIALAMQNNEFLEEIKQDPDFNSFIKFEGLTSTAVQDGFEIEPENRFSDLTAASQEFFRTETNCRSQAPDFLEQLKQLGGSSRKRLSDAARRFFSRKRRKLRLTDDCAPSTLNLLECVSSDATRSPPSSQNLQNNSRRTPSAHEENCTSPWEEQSSTTSWVT